VIYSFGVTSARARRKLYEAITIWRFDHIFGPANPGREAGIANTCAFDSCSPRPACVYTDHETFGSHTDYQLAGSVIAPWTGTRLRGEVATGFQAPSLSELYDTTFKTNNPDLKPQESTTVDIGVEQPFFDRIMVVEVSFFRSKYKNMFAPMCPQAKR
jgi:vitamin B12 transporter